MKSCGIAVGFTLAAHCYDGGLLLLRAGQDSVTTTERFLVLSETDVRSITYYGESTPSPTVWTVVLRLHSVGTLDGVRVSGS
jgi:hypothetical protein